GVEPTDGFIKIPLTVISDQGNLVELNVEAYVVKNMGPQFILGNDFSIPYLLSLIRDPDRSYVKLGRSRETIKVKELQSSHEDSIASHQIEIESNHTSSKNAKSTRQTKRTDKNALQGTVPERSAKEFILK